MDLKLNRGRGKSNGGGNKRNGNGRVGESTKNEKNNIVDPVSNNNNIIKQYFNQSGEGVSAFDQYASNHSVDQYTSNHTVHEFDTHRINTVHKNLNLPDEYLFTPPPQNNDVAYLPQNNDVAYSPQNNNVTYQPQPSYNDYNNDNYNDEYSLTSPRAINHYNYDQNDTDYNKDNYSDEYDPTAPEMKLNREYSVKKMITCDQIKGTTYDQLLKMMTYGRWKARQNELIKWATIFAKRYYLYNEKVQDTKYETWVINQWKKWRTDFFKKTKQKELSLDRHYILASIDSNYMDFIEKH